MNFDTVDAAIINDYQKGIELSSRPFLKLATKYSLTEEDIIERIKKLQADKVISRFGPMYDIARAGGSFLLCAMEVPNDRFKEVTEILNDVDEVAHNYKREHRLNMWFVLAVEDKSKMDDMCKKIEELCDLRVFGFDKEEEYLVHLYLPVEASNE